jgi:hypothetical protein
VHFTDGHGAMSKRWNRGSAWPASGASVAASIAHIISVTIVIYRMILKLYIRHSRLPLVWPLSCTRLVQTGSGVFLLKYLMFQVAVLALCRSSLDRGIVLWRQYIWLIMRERPQLGQSFIPCEISDSSSNAGLRGCFNVD